MGGSSIWEGVPWNRALQSSQKCREQSGREAMLSLKPQTRLPRILDSAPERHSCLLACFVLALPCKPWDCPNLRWDPIAGSHAQGAAGEETIQSTAPDNSRKRQGQERNGSGPGTPADEMRVFASLSIPICSFCASLLFRGDAACSSSSSGRPLSHLCKGQSIIYIGM